MRFKSTKALLVLVGVFAMSAATATSAFASGKPLVETKPATGITKSGATLKGVVNPNGAETTYHFEYGTSTSYGNGTAEVYVGSGTTNVEELQKIMSLLADQTYDFRIVATNSNGTTDGANETFKTSGPKVPLAETVGASAVTETGATLNGVVNPNGVATKYYFEYGTTNSYGTKTAEASAGSGTANLNESATISGLTAKTTYHFRIVATNANGTTDGEDRTFYTNVGPEFKPIPTKKKFTSTGGVGRWKIVYGEIECSKSTTSGEITSATTLVKVIERFTGCKATGEEEENCPAHSEGEGTEEIVTTSLKGELGKVRPIQATSEVGVLLQPETGKVWVTFMAPRCIPEGALEGLLAGEVTSLGKQTTHGLDFALTGENQRIKEITLDSGELKSPRLDFYGAGATFEQTNEMKFEEALEIT